MEKVGKDGTEKAQCILCNQFLTNSSLKPSKLKIHFAVHDVSAVYDTEALKEKRTLYGSGSQTFCDATHLKKLARLCDAPDSMLQFSLPYCEINVTHNLHK